MKSKILKASVIGIVFVLFLIVVSSSVSADNNADNSTNVLTLSKGGITIKYPSDWGYSQGLSNESIMAISKLDSIDSAGVGQVNINVEKKAIEGGDFGTFVNSTYKSFQQNSAFHLISGGEILVGNKKAFEYVYTQNGTNGTAKQHKAVWFEKGGQAYVLLYSAPVAQYESNLYVFEYLLSNIKIT